MIDNKIPEIILEETKNLPEDLLREVLDFILFLKNKTNISSSNTPQRALYKMQQDELTHLEEEFENYKTLYPNE
jgi:hypothetical protein